MAERAEEWNDRLRFAGILASAIALLGLLVLAVLE
jgi:hypothetical protein